jgi:hypothetical protein
MQVETGVSTVCCREQRPPVPSARGRIVVTPVALPAAPTDATFAASPPQAESPGSDVGCGGRQAAPSALWAGRLRPVGGSAATTLPERSPNGAAFERCTQCCRVQLHGWPPVHRYGRVRQIRPRRILWQDWAEPAGPPESGRALLRGLVAIQRPLGPPVPATQSAPLT